MECKKIIEAALFTSVKPLTLSELHEIAKVNVSELRTALNELVEEYNERESGLEIVETINGFKMQVKPEIESNVSKFASKSVFSKSVSKTLAFIAFKQPIKQSDLIKYRTSKAYDDVKFLEQEGYIARQPEGRSFIVRTTRKFLEEFGENAVRLKPREEQ